MQPHVIRSRRVVTPEGAVPATVTVADGRVTAVEGHDRRVGTRHTTDLGDIALLPGLVDLDVLSHAPAGRLGLGYAETLRAAVRGGVTTVVFSPAPARPPVLDRPALAEHARAAAGHGTARAAFLGGVTVGSSPADLAELRAAGVVGFYASLADGGAPDLKPLDDLALRGALAEAAVMDAPLLVHAEDGGELREGAAERPPRAERRGLERVIAAARATGGRAHLVPFTSAECAALLAAAHSAGITVTAQTCPHYLCLAVEGTPHAPWAGGSGRPPLRSNANRAALWCALTDGATGTHNPLAAVGSGHRPDAGAVTVEWTLPALWTAARRRGCGLADLSRWTAQRPAATVGLTSRGRIAVGCHADLTAFDPDALCRVPDHAPPGYAGRELYGRVVGTWVAGRAVLAPGATGERW